MATSIGRNRVGSARLVVGCLLLAGLTAGCSRGHYRRDADNETYQVLAQKIDDSRWLIPHTSIEPPPESRLFDPPDPDHPPIPPDDPAAHRFMHCADGKQGYRGWHDDGDAREIEDQQWREHLSLSEDGTLLLSPERAVELAVLHSREYQSELEDLYFSALALTLNRFEFSLHWFGRNNTAFRHFGTSSTPTESNTLTTASDLGFSRAFASGGQLLVDFANSFVWEFTGRNSSSASSNIGVNLVQPLLRRAGRDVRLEALTQGERNVLYAVRDFARFRKAFYFNMTAGREGYLSLLLQLQNIRNLEANLVSLQRNLEVHEALADAGIASSIQVDQVLQSYQAGRRDLILAQSSFETALDAYKTTLGLPPSVPIDLDDSLLQPFQLNDPALTELEGQIEHFLAEYRELDEAPPPARLKDGFSKLKAFHDRLAKFLDEVDEELARWKAQIPEQAEGEEGMRAVRERAAQQQLVERIKELREDFDKLARDVEKESARLTEEQRTKGWLALLRLTPEETALAGELFVIQTQSRVHLIKLRPVQFDTASATRLALVNRLDLMNQRAGVVDAWRQITVAADGLESDLNLLFDANIATDPGANNPLKLSAAASSYRVGFQLDGPLNRKAERNIYRSQLVNYQRSRRAFMALEDRVEQSIRRDLRQLETDRLNFEIARQSLIIAARQVEQTRDQLVAPGPAGDSSSTQDVLDALNRLLQTKNTLIGTWVSYEVGRLQLLLDMEALQLDERGVYSDEHEHPPDQASEI